jgi:biotin-dependent carboxylase-like uncharacterized protein
MLKVLKSGFYSTVQDSGRFGYRCHGVPSSGAMDMYSCQFANALLGNKLNSAVIEMTMVGGKFQFLKTTAIAISGAKINPRINDVPVKTNKRVVVNTNDVLSFGRLEQGFRAYVAIKGGFKTKMILGSQSQYKTVTDANMLKSGDILNYNNYESKNEKLNSVIKYNDAILSNTIVEVYKGPEFNLLSTHQKEVLFSQSLFVTKNNNRMAYQLEPLLENDLKPMLTSPVLPGTVQLTPSGQLIVLMRDCQTTGGYPRILQLTENAINCMSQKTVGNCLKMRLKDMWCKKMNHKIVGSTIN